MYKQIPTYNCNDLGSLAPEHKPKTHLKNKKNELSLQDTFQNAKLQIMDPLQQYFIK